MQMLLSWAEDPFSGQGFFFWDTLCISKEKSAALETEIRPVRQKMYFMRCPN